MTAEKPAGQYPPFSVAISVYAKDKAEWFDTALASILNQTEKPSEIVLVIDGPVPDKIHNVIKKYEKNCGEELKLRVISFPENRGLGEALKAAVESCSYELIARMDSDDIAVNNRFELQLERFLSETDIDICGGQIEEFIDHPSNIVGKRVVPETDKIIKIYMQKRCPFNHMTVMFRKSAVLRAGNYQDWFWNEDYYLWIRMALNGSRFANIPETLVKVRVGKDMYARRGGDKYFKSELGIQRLMFKKGLINRKTFISNCIKRYIVQKMMPNSIRAWVFKRFARTR